MKTFIIAGALSGTLAECDKGWESANGLCYFFGNEELIKPDAKKVCYDMGSQLVLSSSDAENQFLASKLGAGETLWLRINDSKVNGEWVVDREGYEQPDSWDPVTYFSWSEDTKNTEDNNSAFMDENGKWTIVDKYAKNGFACQKDGGSSTPKGDDLDGKCKDGWVYSNKSCLFFSDSKMIKPDAKEFCYDMGSQLVLVSSDTENDFLKSKLNDGDSFWLRINDSKENGKWVVDREGYEQPSSWDTPKYFNWNPSSVNDEVKNSALLNSDGQWDVVDKYAESRFVCQTPSEEKPREKDNCDDGWKGFEGSCYLFGADKMMKPDAKKLCYDAGSELVLVSNQNEQDFLMKGLKDGEDSFWLRINDSKEENKWVVDREGYEQPDSWDEATFFSWAQTAENTLEKNSALMKKDGWIVVDKYVESRFVCEKASKVADTLGKDSTDSEADMLPDMDDPMYADFDVDDESELRLLVLVKQLHNTAKKMVDSGFMTEKRCELSKQQYLKFAGKQLKYYRRMKDRCDYPINATKADKDAATFMSMDVSKVCESLTALTDGMARWSTNYNKSCTNPNKKPAGKRPDKKYNKPYGRLADKLSNYASCD